MVPAGSGITILFAIAVVGPRQKEGSILVVFVHDQPTPTARCTIGCRIKRAARKVGEVDGITAGEDVMAGMSNS
jgi:hypothetical protein